MLRAWLSQGRQGLLGASGRLRFVRDGAVLRAVRLDDRPKQQNTRDREYDRQAGQGDDPPLQDSTSYCQDAAHGSGPSLGGVSFGTVARCARLNLRLAPNPRFRLAKEGGGSTPPAPRWARLLIQQSSAPGESKIMPQELIEPHGDKRYVRRGQKGRFSSRQVNVGRSLSAGRRSKAKTVVKKGEGDRGDWRSD